MEQFKFDVEFWHVTQKTMRFYQCNYCGINAHTIMQIDITESFIDDHKNCKPKRLANKKRIRND